MKMKLKLCCTTSTELYLELNDLCCNSNKVGKVEEIIQLYQQGNVYPDSTTCLRSVRLYFVERKRKSGGFSNEKDESEKFHYASDSECMCVMLSIL